MALVRLVVNSIFPFPPAGRYTASLLTCACLLALFPIAMMAQQLQPPGWEWQNPLPQGNTINSIRFAADKKHGWAVGSDGAI